MGIHLADRELDKDTFGWVWRKEMSLKMVIEILPDGRSLLWTLMVTKVDFFTLFGLEHVRKYVNLNAISFSVHTHTHVKMSEWKQTSSVSVCVCVCVCETWGCLAFHLSPMPVLTTPTPKSEMRKRALCSPHNYFHFFLCLPISVPSLSPSFPHLRRVITVSTGMKAWDLADPLPLTDAYSFKNEPLITRPNFLQSHSAQ